MASYYHIGFFAPPETDHRAIEKAIGDSTLDWMRYAANCYVVWAEADAAMLAGALLSVRGMNEGRFVITRICPESYALLPRSLWDWIGRDRTPSGPVQDLVPTVPLDLPPPFQRRE